MGRECRRVPADWEHPRDETGSYVPLYPESFSEAAAEWKEGYKRWEAGETRDHAAPGPAIAWRPRQMDKSWEGAGVEYWEYDGPPDRESYRSREWTPEQATHFQMYETCSEGTPISPVLPTPEAVARWCADNGASAFAGETASYEGWLRVAMGGYAPTMVMDGRGIVSGVDGFD